MKFFTWFFSKSGKMAVSALQAAGLTTVIGAAGIAAYQYLNSTPDVPFDPLTQYDPGQIQYVSTAANTGGYASRGYNAGTLPDNATGGSSMHISANTLRQLERQDRLNQTARDMEEFEPVQPNDVPTPQAYQMGGSEGLGMGGNFGNENNPNNPMAMVQQQMSGIQNMVAQAQQGAATGASGAPAAPGAQGAEQSAAPTLASAGRPDWGRSSALGGGKGGSSGNAFNSTFTVQDSGKGTPGANAPQTDPAQLLASAQRQMAGAVEGARMRTRASFGPDENVGPGRNAHVLNGRNSKETRDLEFIRKRSADAALNRNRSTNEGARAFLASTNISGGMSINTENFVVNSDQKSKDFNTSTSANLRGIKNWSADNVELPGQERTRARNKLRTTLFVVMGVVMALIPVIGWFMALGRMLLASVITAPLAAAKFIIGYCLAAAGAIAVGTLMYTATSYASKYGGSSLSTWANITGGLLLGGIAAALWIPAVGSLLGKMCIGLGLSAGGAVGLGAAWAIDGATSEGAGDVGSTDGTENLNPENDETAAGGK